MMKKTICSVLLAGIGFAAHAETMVTSYVNPFIGTAPLTDEKDVGYPPPWRVWAGLTYPGAALPNAMVQLSPITQFNTGAGYQYEDQSIKGFAHTNQGHWNRCHLPVLPVSGEVNPRDFASGFSHRKESAEPGYYQVYLDRYKIDVELTTTLHCGYHRYTYKNNDDKRLIVNLAQSNEKVHGWEIEQDGDKAFKGFQHAFTGKVFFYAEVNHRIAGIDKDNDLSVVRFEDARRPLEMKIGMSLVSVENARKNMKELDGKNFDQVRRDALKTWEELLLKIKVEGGSDKEKEMFYSSLYRAFLWPALRSDINGEYPGYQEGDKKDFRLYTRPALWDTYRNKLVLLGMLSPDVAADVIQSLVYYGRNDGFMPTYFHGDHAAVFVAGSYLRGIRDFDVKKAYEELLNNATKPGGPREHLMEYIEKGYIVTPEVSNPHVETKAKAGVTKTLEYAYDDYALAQLAHELGDLENHDMLMARSANYKNLFDPSTGLMRGRLENGEWVDSFDAEHPYYEYMYREANAWQSSFFVPHDVAGLVGLYEDKEAFEDQLDTLFSKPWNPKHVARNVSGFIGQYCHGNQPDHNYPYLYYWVGEQPKTQKVLDEIMDTLYGMGDDGLALCGMDDCGEMSAWYVFNAIGLYPYSPADPEYIITVPIFDRVELRMANTAAPAVIRKYGKGRHIRGIRYGTEILDRMFISHDDLARGLELTVSVK
ncbi:MAG: GH92 family glycosyl hydrolase [Pontiellaceae bacterium]|nr:GH92 family glycosyl hydrolase [Pontiellaceae bacterium]MBN2786187.1 GH92 family glycosyl hydrolase [Pontiellaceae bacterium]